MMNRYTRRRAEALARQSKLQQTGATHPSPQNSSALPTWRMALLGSAAIGAMAVSGDVGHANFVASGGPTAGADSITVSTSDLIDGGTVDFLAGNDTISFGVNVHIFSANGATVTGGDDDDTVQLSSNRVGEGDSGAVTGGTGNDSIALSNSSDIGRNAGSTGTVLGDLGDDTITLISSRVGYSGAGTVSGGDGVDSIALSFSDIGYQSSGTGTVLGDLGDDTITLDVSRVGDEGAGTVSGGDGSDSIELSASSNIGNELGSTGTVLGDLGDDAITLNNSDVGNAGAGTVSGGDGADSIALSNSSSIGDYSGSTGVVLGDVGDDTITLDGFSSVGNSGAGTVSGGDGADSIALSASSNIGNSASSTGTVLGDLGNDTITLDRSAVGNSGAGTVSGGDGSDSIALTNGSVLAEGAGSTGQVLGDAGQDTIFLDGSTVGRFGAGTVSGGADDDSIVLFDGSHLASENGSSAQVLGDAGDDTITFNGSRVGDEGAATVDGGTGNDSIALTYESSLGEEVDGTGQVLGGAGDDTITLNDMAVVGRLGAGTVSGGEDNDSIAITNEAHIGSLSGSTGIVLGDAGSDTITIDYSAVGYEGAATVSGGADNDSIALTDDADIGREAGSTGIVLGDAGNDTITIDDSAVGNDGSATVSGGADDDSISITGTSSINATSQVLGDAGNDTISIDSSITIAAGATIDGGVGFGDVLSVNFVAGGNAIDFSGFDNFELVDLNGNATVDIAALPADFSIVGIGGNSTITLATTTVSDLFRIDGTLQGTAGADSVTLNPSSVIGRDENTAGQLLGDVGADTITLDNGYVGFSGAGTVSGGADNDSIVISNRTNLGYASGSTGQVLGDGGEDTITLDRAYVGRSGSGTVDGGANNDLITISNASGIGRNDGGAGQVLGGVGEDTITINGSNIGQSGSATVSGGADNDSIAISSISNIANNASGTGQVLGEEGDDTITLDRSVVGSRGAATVSGGAGNDSIALSTFSNIGNRAGSTGQVLGDAGDDTITLADSYVGDSGDATVSGGEGNDSIALSGASVIARFNDATGQILGDAGNDTITLDDTDVAVSGAATVSGGDGADSISFDDAALALNQGATAQVLGDAGNDSITISSSLIGGAGQATVDSGDDDDVITLTPVVFGSRTTLGEQAGSEGVILGGDGDDSVSLGNAAIGGDGAGRVDGGDGADSIAIDNGEVGSYVGSSGQILGGDGGDTISISDTNVGDEGNATVDGGEGDDAIALENGSSIGFEATASGQVLGGAGSDTIAITGSSVGEEGSATVSGGADGDSITIDGMSAVGFMAGGSGQVLGDGGDDTIAVVASAIGYNGSGTVDGGEGADNISFDAAVVGLNAGSSGQVLGGAGNDTISFNDTDIGVDGAATIDTGAGDDSITLTGATEIGGNASITTGAGNDTVSFELTVEIDDNSIVDGGTGTDTLIVLTDSDQEISADAIQGFERFAASGGGNLTLTGDANFTEGLGSSDGGTLVTQDNVVTSNIVVDENSIFEVGGTLRSNGTGVAGGANPGNGQTIVEESTLNNNGTFISSGGTFVEEGGVLSGNGIFEGLVTANDGIISPGNSIGVQTFNSGLTLNSGTTLIIEVSDTGVDRVNVVGQVAINGATLQLDDFAPVADDLNATVTIVDNDGTDAITGSGFGTIVDNLAFLDPTVVVNGGDGNDVTLQLVPTATQSAISPSRINVASIAVTPNQAAIAAAFDSTPDTNSDIQTLLNELTPLTFAQARTAVNSLSGETHASTQFATGSAGLFVGDSFNNALNGFALGDQARANAGNKQTASAIQALALAPGETASRSYAADLVLSEKAAKQDRGYVFGRGLFRQSNIDADANGGATETQNRGFVAGGGINFNERFAAGVGVGYLRTDIDVNSLNSESETDAIVANIHARYKQNNYDLTGNLGYTFSNIETERRVAVGAFNQTARANYDADTVFGSAEAGYTTVLNQFAFRPFVGGAFSFTSTDGFTETGAGGVNLVTASSDNTLGQFTAGVSASTQFNIGPALVVPRIEVAYDQLLGDVTPATTAAFQAGGASFSSVGATPGRSRGRISAGFAAVLSARVNSFIEYQGVFSSNDRTHAVRSGLRVKF
ncbi:MAG: hypothetical protein ABJK39_07915 [Hyphomicrobiales bacterium]